MKTLLKLSLASLALGVLAPFSWAQDDTVAVPVAPAGESAAKRGKGAAAERMKDRVQTRDETLAAKLNLTAAQKDQLAALRKEQAEQLKAARGDRTKMAALAKTFQDQVRALLTAEQRQKFDKMTPQPRGGGAPGKGKGKKAGKL